MSGATDGRDTLSLDDLKPEAPDLFALAASRGMTIGELARWAERPAQAEALARLERLAHRRASLLVAGARAEAASALLRLALDATSAETARKACVDLLRLPRESVEEETIATGSEAGAAPDATMADSLRSALDKLAGATGGAMASTPTVGLATPSACAPAARVESTPDAA